MLYLKCEYCICSGVINVSEPNAEKGDKPTIEVCPLCLGTGYHRILLEGSIDSLRRLSVLRVLDLAYVEHKNKKRIKRLMDLFYIVPLPEEPGLTEAALELLNK
jgi:hypothetical protein